MYPMIDWDERRLRRRWPPVAGLQLVLLGLVVMGAVIEISSADSGWTRAPLESPRYLLDGVGWILFLAQFPLLFLMPATGALLVAAVSFGLSTIPGMASTPAVWMVTATAALAVAGWLIAAQLRPAQPAPVRQLPSETPYEQTAAYRKPRLGLSAIGVTLAVGIALVLAHNEEAQDVRAFEERAQTVAVEVLDVDHDYQLRVHIDGAEHWVGTGWLEPVPEPGDRVAVLVDPTDPSRVVLSNALEDPSWLLGGAALTPFAAWFALWRWVVPPLNRRRLIADGGPLGRARLVDVDEDHMFLIPSDASWPAMRVIRLDELGPPIEGSHHWEPGDEELDEDDSDDDETADELPTTPEEFRTFLDEIYAEDEDDAEFDLHRTRLFGPDASTPVSVSLIGLPGRGASIAIQHKGLTWLAELSDSSRVFRLRAKLRQIDTRGAAQGWLTRLIDYQPQLLRAMWSLLVAAVGSTIVWGNLWDDPTDWFGPLLFGLLWAGAIVGYGIGDGSMALRRDAIVFYGMFLDEVVPASRVQFVAANDELIGLRLTDPDDIYYFGPEGLIKRSDATTQQALALLDTWRSEASPRRGGKRPGLPLVGASVLLLSTAVAVGVALFS